MTEIKKAVLRREAESRRGEIGERERSRLGDAVRERMRSFEALRDARLVALYASKGAEVPTQGIFEDVVEAGKVAALPRVDGGLTRLHRLVAWRDLVPGSFGVREPPAAAAPVAPEDVDLWLVPGVAFDEVGRRLGRGGGHYDRLLAQARPRAPRVGLCYEAQVFEAVPTEAHDICMDFLVTESRVVGPLARDDSDRSER